MGWIITDEHNPLGGQWAEHGRTHIKVPKLCAVVLGILAYCNYKNNSLTIIQNDS